MKNKNPGQHFFDENLQNIASQLAVPDRNLQVIEELGKFNQQLDKPLQEFAEIFFKASPKLKTLMWYNPHLQLFLTGIKPGLWINFEEMFPGDPDVWNYLLRTRQLFHERSLNVIFEELQIINPLICRIKDNFLVDLQKAKTIIGDNLDIFNSLRKKPYIAVTNEETKMLLHKISLNLNPKNIANVRSPVGVLLGYPRKQALLHTITDNLDLQIFIPKFNDFSVNGFYEQTYPLLANSGHSNQLNNLFAYLEEHEYAMNHQATAFKEQDFLHNEIMITLSNNCDFLRNIIFEYYLPQSISQKAADYLDEYMLYSFPHLAFPTTMPFHQFGLNWLEYQPDLDSELLKGKMLLTIRKISEWKQKMVKKYHHCL